MAPYGTIADQGNMAGIVLSILGTAALAAALWLGTRWLYGYCRMIYYVGRIPKPTPNGHWLFGHIFELPPCQSTMIKMIARNRSTGHALTASWVGPFISLVAITHPEPLKQLLKEPKSWIYHLLLPWLGDGLLVSNGPKWARNRRLLTPAFHYEILKPYVDVYNSCSEVLLNKWSALAQKNEPVMAFESVSLLTLDVVLQCAFSFKSDCQDTGTHAPYIKAVYELSEWIVQRVIYPPYQSNLFFYLSPDGRKFRKACKLVHDHSEKLHICAAHATKVLLLSETLSSHMTGVFLSILGTAFLAAALWLGTRWLYGYCRMIYYIGRIPSPPNRHWLWGHLYEFPACEASLLKIGSYNRTKGHDLTSVWFGPFICAVYISHPEAFKQVLKGDGLLVSNGPKWARNRRLLTPAFHYEILKPYVDVYNSCSEVLLVTCCYGDKLNKWSALAKKNEPVMAFESVSLLTLDVVLQCAFSFKSDCQDTGARSPYIQGVYDLSEWVVQRVMYAPYQSDLVFHLSPDGKKFRKACKVVHDHSEKASGGSKMTEGTLGASKKAQGKYLDFLDILLTAVDEEGRGLSDLDVRNEADTFMFEGHDTTASGISWTLYLLAKHPEHQEKCRDEIRTVLDGRSHLEFADLPKLQYTHWCIKEAMRLYPPVQHIYRNANEDILLQGYLVPRELCNK
eukprot:Em0007g596a